MRTLSGLPCGQFGIGYSRVHCENMRKYRVIGDGGTKNPQPDTRNDIGGVMPVVGNPTGGDVAGPTPGEETHQPSDPLPPPLTAMES